MGLGISLVFGFIALLAAVAAGATSYMSFLIEPGDAMQLYSGLAIALALLAGSLAVASIHLFE